MGYQRLITNLLDTECGLSPEDFDPRHIEAMIRLDHPMLDSISRSDFALEIDAAVQVLADVTLAGRELLADSFGL